MNPVLRLDRSGIQIYRLETMTQTPTFRLADRLVDEGVEAFVNTRRAQGKSWRIIARDLWTATDGEIDVTYETLRSWFADEPTEAA